MIELTFTQEQLDSIPRYGSADTDISVLVADTSISAQLDALDPTAIRNALRPYGAWDTDELADDEANRNRIVWLAVGKCKDEQETFAIFDCIP